MGTTPISHAGHSGRFPWSCSISFPVSGKPSRFECLRQAGARGSGSNSQKEAVESQTKAAEENQRREVLRHQGKDRNREWNLKRSTVPGSEIINDGREKHIKKSAANLVPPVGPPALRQLHLWNGFAAKRALRQMRRHVLAAKYAAALVRGLISKSAHPGPGPHVPPT